AGAIQLHCEKTMPAYMVPQSVTVTDRIPLTPNGKVDKQALARLIDAATLPAEVCIAPRNPVEAQLETIWKLVLGKQQVSVRDNFFRIGGHSLKATQVVSKIHKELNVKLDIGVLFASPTIEALAGEIARSRQEAYQQIPALAEQDHYPLSHGQRRLWVLSQLEENQAAFNIAGAYRLKGILDVEAFQKCFETLAQRHQVLRTTFVEVNGEPRQRVEPAAGQSFTLNYRDLREEEDRENAARRLTGDEARRLFSLSTGPLLRVQLLQLEDDHYVCLLTMHHIVSDGWSMDVLMREITTLYAAFRTGAGNPLPPLRIHYKDYASWHNEQLLGEQSAGHQQYWQSQFEGEIPVLEFPADYPRPRI
ncbi:MAG: non-ribosomal peptide synthetase, partial [Cytophagales bacterium]|nr:non-ribosomal peptide synthetase [Cytophagales bacterium]